MATKRATKPERQYVCAFVKGEFEHVLLVRKKQPAWQSGKLNGIGGKIEEQDAGNTVFSPQLIAMMREWKEETGLESEPDFWQEVVYLWGQDKDGNFWGVHFFTYPHHDWNLFELIKQRPFNDVGEELVMASSWALPGKDDIIPNLKWLVPLCLYGKYLDLPIKINDIENNN